MPSLHTILAALAATTCLLPTPASAAKACPPLGPVLPAPRKPSSSAASSLSKATASLAALLDARVGSLNGSAVSVGVKSLHEDAHLFSYHHTPRDSLSDIGEVGDDTIYRVGSVSKMVPILALQMVGADLDASVLEYVPELADAEGGDGIDWAGISVRSLADHLSGLGTDLAMDLAINPLGPWEAMGLPPVRPGSGPTCSGLPGTQPCNRTDLVRDINRRKPVYSPQATPVYSNIAYAMLGLVLEGAVSQQQNKDDSEKPMPHFPQVAKDMVFDLANMSSTSFDGPVDGFAERGFVPLGEVTWNVTLGAFESAGGMFSSTTDMLRFAEGILSHRFLSPRDTRAWMKPAAHTSSLGFSTGGGWEILRGDDLTPDGRTIDVYTKSGDLGTYHALLGVVPEYGVSVSVLCAGGEVTAEPHSRSAIFSAVARALFPVLDEAARSEAADVYAGTYVDEETNSTLVVGSDAADNGGSGLVIGEFRVRGFDVMGNIDSYSLFATEAPPSSSSSSSSSKDTPKVTGRLYPTLKDDEKSNNGTTTWRAVFDSATEEEKAELQAQLFWPGAACESWFGLDRAVYGFASLAEFEFLAGGRAVRNGAFGVTMKKVRAY